MSSRNIDLLLKFESALSQQKWDELSSLLDPKLFRTLERKKLIAFPVLAKVAQILTTEGSDIPEIVKIACLKCLGNSCFNGYIHKEYISSNAEHGMYCNKLYSVLANNNESLKDVCHSYPFDSYFPYEGIVEWTSNFIVSHKIDNNLRHEQLEILRLSIQFLCNLFTFAYKDSNFPDEYNTPKYLNEVNLKDAIMNLAHCEHVPLVRVSCIFIHNVLKEYEGRTFTESEKSQLCLQLLKPIKDGLESAREALMFLLCQPNVLRNAYNDLSVEDKLFLLEIIYNEISNLVYKSEEEHILSEDTIEFLSERFCSRSDLILKTVDTCSNEKELTEIVILLDILGALTSRSSKKYSFMKNYKSLLINCTYLLKSIQMIGNQSSNYFTPMRKLSDLMPAVQIDSNSQTAQSEENGSSMNSGKDEPHRHPAFGFKADLIGIIGNMSYRNKECQDLLRDMDAIPLLLDCCNIDARNPLIMQWTILALRNLCEDNPENQEIIRNCTKVGVVENSVLQEMGLTLHEDEEGKKIGVVPLPRDKK